MTRSSIPSSWFQLSRIEGKKAPQPEDLGLGPRLQEDSPPSALRGLVAKSWEFELVKALLGKHGLCISLTVEQHGPGLSFVQKLGERKLR
jgi:hypothetical protein